MKIKEFSVKKVKKRSTTENTRFGSVKLGKNVIKD